MRRVLLITGLGCLLLAQPGIPPDQLHLRSEPYFPPSQKLLTTEARSVEVGVVVRDLQGRPVSGLTRDDFALEDGGKRRELTHFSVEALPSALSDAAPSPSAAAVPAPKNAPSNRPRFLALVFDDLQMGPADLVPVRTAARRFVTEGRTMGDRASVFFLSRGEVVPFTADTLQLSLSLDGLKPGRPATEDNCPGMSIYEAYRIAELHDSEIAAPKVQEAATCGACGKNRGRPGPDCPIAVNSVAKRIWDESRERSNHTLLFLGRLAEGMVKLPGQRIIVLATSGFLATTLERELQETVDKALRNGVVINALDAKGLYTQDLHLEGNHVTIAELNLRQKLGTRAESASNDAPSILADSTGGIFFHNNNDLHLGFQEIGLAPAVTYRLAFSPAGPPDGKYHPISVHLTTAKHYAVQARPGYYDPKLPPAQPQPELPIDKEVMATDTPGDVPAYFSQSANGAAALHVVLQLGVGKLPFVVQDGVRRLQVDFIAALFDERSVFVTGSLGQAIFALKDDGFRRMHDGLNSGLTLRAPPGKYRLRCVVRESNGGKFTAWNQPVEIK